MTFRPHEQVVALRPEPSRVLVVAGSFRVRDALSALVRSISQLELAGSEASSTEALACCESGGIDGVLLDIPLRLPEEDAELIRQFRDRGLIVAVTSARGALRQASMQAGANCFFEQDGSGDAIAEVLVTSMSLRLRP